MGAPWRLCDDLVDHLEVEQVRRGDPERRGGTLAHLGALAVLPEDCRAPLHRDHGIHGVLQHVHPVGNAERECAARAAFANDGRDDRRFQPAHLEQVARNRLALPALLRAQAGPRSRRVDERQHGHVKLLGQLHQAERLSVTLRMRHPEIALEILLGVAATLVPNHHHGLPVQPGPPAHDGRIFAEGAIAMQLDEVGEAEAEVVIGERTLVAARHLHPLQRREAPVDVIPQLEELLLQRRDLVCHVQCLLAHHLPQFLDLALEIEDRLLELEIRTRHPCQLPRTRRTRSFPSSARRSVSAA